MKYMDTDIVTDAMKAKVTFLSTIVNPNEFSQAQSKNQVVAEEVFKLFKKNYNDVLHSDGGARNCKLTLCSVEKRLTELMKGMDKKVKENIATQQFANNDMESELQLKNMCI